MSDYIDFTDRNTKYTLGGYTKMFENKVKIWCTCGGAWATDDDHFSESILLGIFTLGIDNFGLSNPALLYF